MALEKFCHACGEQILTMAEICPKCGVRQAGSGRAKEMRDRSEGAGGVAKIGSFCVPLIGLILYLVWQDSKPQAAKDVCTWTIAGIVAGFVVYFLFMGAALSSF